MDISKFTCLGFYLVRALDTGKYNDVTVDEIARQIESGGVFDFLEKKLGTDIFLSRLDTDDRTELSKEWQGMVAALDEKRKLGIEKNGLCLLLVYVLEGIQRQLAAEQRAATIQ